MEWGEVKSNCVLFLKMTDGESQGQLPQSWTEQSHICSENIITVSYDAMPPHTPDGDLTVSYIIGP